MIYSIEIKEEARQDILQAALWYSDKAIDLHLKFINQVEITLQSIQSNPKAFKKVYKTFRQAALNKFPYVVLYESNENAIIIFSVFHSSQHPRKKLQRLKQ